MKMFVISDNVDTLTGMRLAGVDGVLAHTREEFSRALEAAVKDPSNGVVLLTEKFGRDYPDLVNGAKLSSAPLPLILDVPDRHGSGRRPDFITGYVEEAIGLKL